MTAMGSLDIDTLTDLKLRAFLYDGVGARSLIRAAVCLKIGVK